MLIKLMLENPETVISNRYFEQVWGHQFDPQTNVVDVLVCRLRSKVDKGFDAPLIHTPRGVAMSSSHNIEQALQGTQHTTDAVYGDLIAVPDTGCYMG